MGLEMVRVPLAKLAAAPEGVRRVKRAGFITELAANIEANGLLMNLLVRREGKRFTVIDGQQRLAALHALLKKGKVDEAFEVPCRVIDESGAGSFTQADGHAVEVSLAANVLREGMHPADEFEAFRTLVDSGMPAAEIASRFGRTETHVQRLLRLARVSPKVIKAYRDEKINLEWVQAFAITDDQAAQEKVLKGLKDHYGPHSIRAQLTQNEVPADDARVGFVGLEAYEAAGGKVRRDLFADVEDEDGDTPVGAYIENEALLDELVTAKLAETAAALKAEGWKWVETRAEFPYAERATFQRLHAEPAPLSPEEQARKDALQKELDALQEKDEPEDEEAAQKEIARMDELEDQLQAIEDAQEEKAQWTPQQLAIAGAVVFLGHGGKEVVRGLVKPEDRVAGKQAKAVGVEGTQPDPDEDGEAAEEPGTGPGAGLSAALVESLSTHKSAALAAVLAGNPDVALRAVVHTLAASLLFEVASDTLPLKIAPDEHDLRPAENSPAAVRLTSVREAWLKRLAIDPMDDDLSDRMWAWCQVAEPEHLLELLAVCAALTVDAVLANSYHHGVTSEGYAQADRIAQLAGLGMREWFTPTAETYFGRVGKTQILAALKEAVPETEWEISGPRWAKLKKGELAKVAEAELAGTPWLPELLRVGPHPPAPSPQQTGEGETTGGD